jgi:hypothetical protein
VPRTVTLVPDLSSSQFQQLSGLLPVALFRLSLFSNQAQPVRLRTAPPMFDNRISSSDSHHPAGAGAPLPAHAAKSPKRTHPFSVTQKTCNHRHPVRIHPHRAAPCETIPLQPTQTKVCYAVYQIPSKQIPAAQADDGPYRICSYQLRLAVLEPMQAMSGNPSAFRSATVHASAACFSLSSVCRVHFSPVSSAAS